MKLTGIDIQIIHRKRFLKLRNQNRLVQSIAFLDAWDLAGPIEHSNITSMLCDVDPLKIKRWIRSVLYDDFEHYTTIELRQLASKNYIKNYSRMTKETLIHTLIQRGIEDDGSKRRERHNSRSLGDNETPVNSSGLPKTPD